jgi:hypothetical protein
MNENEYYYPTSTDEQDQFDIGISQPKETFEYSQLPQVMGGSNIMHQMEQQNSFQSSVPIDPAKSSSSDSTIVVSQHTKDKYPLEYESLSSVLKKSDRSQILKLDSIDDWYDLGHSQRSNYR